MTDGTVSTRRRIQTVALELFTEQGYEKTSLREIAERLGVTKAALYYHFKSKDDIVNSFVEDRIDRLDELIKWGRDQPADVATRRRRTAGAVVRTWYVSSEAPSGEAESVDGYVQRAQLLAELGRHDEAADELGFAVALDPANPRTLTVLAQVHLAGDRPAEALAAAEAATAAAPDAAYPFVLRALALIDLRRFGEAARIADELLARWPTDAYAQRSAAAILGEARNGQPALNAAWRGVELASTEAEAHLVLGLIAARLELFDLAERAYREALRLDPSLAEAGQDVGIIRLERRRYTLALAKLAELAAAEPSAAATTASGSTTAGPARTAADPPRRQAPADELRRLALWGAGYSMAAVVLAACVAAGNVAMSRIFAAVAAAAALLMGWRFAARAPGVAGARRSDLLRGDRILALSWYAALAGPLLLLGYALTGAPWPLVLALAGTAVAQLALLFRRR